MADDLKVDPKERGEQSKLQSPPRRGGGILGMAMDGPQVKAPPPETFATWRLMRRNPTIALARAVAMAPIRMAMIVVRADDGVDQKRIDFIQAIKDRHWRKLIRDMLGALDFGFAPFEIIYDLDESLLFPSRIKPLLPDKTDILINEGGSEFAGFKQKQVELSVGKSFLYTHDQEGDDFYGHSRNEAALEPWNSWTDLRKRQRQFAQKAAGIIPMVLYPEGESEDKSGSMQSNFDLAERLLAHLGQGNGVAMPDTLAKYAGDMLRAGFDPAKFRAWQISFLETTGRHGKDFVDQLRHDEALMLRGWTVPERAVTESQFGSRADAEEHGSVSLAISDLTLDDIIDATNKGLIDKVLNLNWGAEAVGTVYLETEGLDSMTRLFFRGLAEKILSQPDNVLILRDLVDLSVLTESIGLPAPADAGMDRERLAASIKAGAEEVVQQYAASIAPAMNIDVDD